jgi:hypothetical protein
MKIPFKPSLLQIRRKKPRWIILHHTSEIYDNPEARIDNDKFQIPGLSKGVLEKKHIDINYHYVIDKIKGDYMVVVCRPLVYMCEWDDIHSDINNSSIHVSLLGNYDYKIPEKRLIEVLSYRLLNPMLKQFGISPNRIKLHNEVSNNDDLTCPGNFIDRAIIESMVRRFVIK